LLGCQRGEDTAVLQIALDLIPGNPITNDRSALERHLPQQLRLPNSNCALDDINVTAVAVDNLSAITPRRTKADLGSLQHRHSKAVLQKKQSAGQARIPCANHTHISFHLTLQLRARRGWIG